MTDKEKTTTAAWLMVAALVIALISAAYNIGVDRGRSQFHQEILEELDANGGAPVLLYPPDEVPHE